MTHNLESFLVYVHPPLAIVGYIFIISSLIVMSLEKKSKISEKLIRKNLYLAWFFNFTGLISGILWAHIAWGSYWSWDPKESVTLVIFTLVCFSVLVYNEYKEISRFLLIFASIVILLNIIITVSNIGLHSYF
jgi:ABC-type transport system involved in cytochrome c biogenesis permease subunit